MPYKLVFRAEAMILVDVSELKLRRTTFNEGCNTRSQAQSCQRRGKLFRIRKEVMKLRIVQKYNKQAHLREFNKEDLVLRKIEA